MSIMVNGTLLVQRINGVRGEFSVGKLKCDIGVLNIKDPNLDQYETGTYQGRFGIAKVYAHGYAASTGCFIVETRAILDEYIIHSDEPGTLETDVALKDVDPLETKASLEPDAPDLPATVNAGTTSVAPPDNTAPADRNNPHPDLSVQAEAESTDPLAALFGELWPLGAEVKLDPTTVRTDPENHRKRCSYLKESGYEFKAKSQSWMRKDVQKPDRAPEVEVL